MSKVHEEQVNSTHLKIEKISRQTIGHLQRMGNQKGVLGWPSEELEEVKAKAVKHPLNTGENYKTRARILTIEMQALNREARKTFVNERAAYIQKWQETRAERGDIPRCQRSELSTLTTCDICLQTCRTIGGLKAQIRRMHKQRRAEEHVCGI